MQKKDKKFTDLYKKMSSQGFKLKQKTPVEPFKTLVERGIVEVEQIKDNKSPFDI